MHFTGTMKYCLSLCCVFYFIWDSKSLSTRSLTFEDDRCFGPFHPSPRENFTVIHKGLDSSGICRDMSFSGWDYADSRRRESCVKVNSVKLDCSQKFVYRTDSNRAKPVKIFDCYDTADVIPVFCTFELLYIRIQTEEAMKNTEVVYTVYSGREKPSYERERGVGWVVPTIVSLGLLGVICASVCCVRMKKARELQNQRGTIAFNRNQQPQIHIHHYHPVHQSCDQEASSSSVNRDMRPGEPLPRQGKNLPPDTYQFQSYPQHTAPTTREDNVYPPRQHFISSNISDSTKLEQYGNDINVPPPYDEVTKQYV
ncbi:uncharacterized protein LOC133179349 [Saccostrea echinata]|uniref:uncharacterized protein LOC133179349 n=1 Tax=Saccostrea echinata TaxID=191078 RepID=UPI002A82E4EE|nr:uncharacterized protein LOC133179349 [Saccostrea echinata]